MPNSALAGRLGVDDAWIVKRTGVHTRRRAAPTERLSDMATWAARRALNDAGVEPYDIDLVLVATMSQDEITPNTAPLVAHELGAERAGAMDIGAACSGFLAALRMAAGQIETGRADRILVIGAEALTRLLDFDDPKTAHLFGDGAGAVVLGADGAGAIGPIMLAADGSPRPRDHLLLRGPRDPHGRPLDLPDGRQAPDARRPSPPSRAPAWSSTTSTSSSTTRPTAASSARSASGSTSSRPRSPTTSRTWPTRARPRSRSR